ncbi:MAG: class F sortase [Jatrophihabitantaceae bacterium]
MSRRRRRPVDRSAYAGWIPLACIMAAICLVAISAIVWVTSPNWGLHNAIAPSRDVGVIPTVPSKPSPLITPDRIEIPKIGTDAAVFAIPTAADGALDPPIDPRQVGWWDGGVRPGSPKGTAIITSHINYAGVAGALARIGLLNPGDAVYIYGINAAKTVKAKYTITGVRSYYKTALPYKEIFDQKSVGRVALVTCGGPFDQATGNYLENIVVFAVPA